MAGVRVPQMRITPPRFCRTCEPRLCPSRSRWLFHLRMELTLRDAMISCWTDQGRPEGAGNSRPETQVNSLKACGMLWSQASCSHRTGFCTLSVGSDLFVSTRQDVHGHYVLFAVLADGDDVDGAGRLDKRNSH